jgi:hypothetical protein
MPGDLPPRSMTAPQLRQVYANANMLLRRWEIIARAYETDPDEVDLMLAAMVRDRMRDLKVALDGRDPGHAAGAATGEVWMEPGPARPRTLAEALGLTPEQDAQRRRRIADAFAAVQAAEREAWTR